MPFFKELRRRSRASFRTSDSSAESNGTVPTTKSTSTLNSSYGASTPPSSVQPNGSTSNVTATKSNGDSTTPPLPPRPSVAPLKSNRNSTVVRDHTSSSLGLFLIAAFTGSWLLRLKRNNALACSYFSVCTKTHFNSGQYRGTDGLSPKTCTMTLMCFFRSIKKSF